MRSLVYLTLEAPRAGQASHVHVMEIIAGLERRGWDVRLLKPAYTDAATKPRYARRIWEYFRLQWALLRGRRADEAIYVRGHYMAWPTALIARLARIPIVHEINGNYTDIFVTYPQLSPVRRPLEFLQRQQYRWADRLLPVTPQLADWLAKESGHRRVTVVSNGVNTDLFRPALARPADAPAGSYVAFFGGLAKWHGVDLMLAATESKYWPDGVRLVVLGKGQESERVQQVALLNDRVVYLGRRPYRDVAAYVANALAGVVAITDPGKRSSTGMLPLKLFETLACGIPAIVTDLPGQADLVREAGCGVVIGENPGELAQAVAKLAASPGEANEMGQKGFALVSADHSWDRKASEIDGVLRRLVSDR
jgi:glycosyltransferase involved in cell wall biosynthesis